MIDTLARRCMRACDGLSDAEIGGLPALIASFPTLYMQVRALRVDYAVAVRKLDACRQQHVAALPVYAQVDHLRAVNAELVTALAQCEDLLADLERGGAENPELHTARAALARAKNIRKKSA